MDVEEIGLILLWVISIVVLGFLMFTAVFGVISISHLENDYVNSVDMCKTLNGLVLPEYVVQAGLVIYLFFFKYWIEFAIAAPTLAYHAYLYRKGLHLLDPVRLYHGEQLRLERKKYYLKLIYYLICFMFFLYRIIEKLTLINLPTKRLIV